LERKFFKGQIRRGRMEKEFSIIGKPQLAQDSLPKVMGNLRYGQDYTLPRMLWGKLLRSPYPHAKILSIDTSKAERLSGVKAVITGRDTLGKRFGLPWSRVDGGPDREPFYDDQYALAVDKVLFIGDTVAAVAAIDEDTAIEAIDLIDVEYEPLQPVFDPEEAMQPNAPQLHDRCDRNIYIAPVILEYGDVDKGFKESDYIREDMIEVRAPIHAFIEPLAALSNFDPATKKLTLWTTCQVVNWVRTSLSETLNIPEKDIMINQPTLGGGFGGKMQMFSYDYCAAHLSMKTERPVKIVQDMDEIFATATRKCEYKYYIKTGVKKDGTLVAREARVIANGGAYVIVGLILAAGPAAFLHVPFKIPNFKATGYRVYTNTPPRSVQRGGGYDTTNYVDGMHLDMIAEDIGIDPVEIRLKNVYKAGETTGLGWRFPSYGLTECIKRAVEKSGWKEKWGKLSPLRGIGIGHSIDIVGLGIPPGQHIACIVKLHENGRVTVNIPSWEMGQSYGVMNCMVVAEVLGVDVKNVEYITTGTDNFPTEVTGANEGTNAVHASYKAAMDARNQLFEFVANLLECNKEDLESKDQRIFVKETPERGIGFFEAVNKYVWQHEKGTPIIGTGSHYCGEDFVKWIFETHGKGNLAETYTMGAYIAEVELDPETGIVKVDKMTCAYDVGKAINPFVVEGQIHGGAVMGMGYALWEGMLYGDKGEILTTSFMSYGLNSAVDAPDIGTIIVEIPDPTQTFGVKSVGMGALHPAPGAVMSAIYDATRGKPRVKEMPMTPDKIAKSMEGEN